MVVPQKSKPRDDAPVSRFDGVDFSVRADRKVFKRSIIQEQMLRCLVKQAANPAVNWPSKKNIRIDIVTCYNAFA